MKTELVKRFIKKIIVKIIIFTLIMSMVSIVGQSISSIVGNYVAMGQMQNDDFSFVIMNVYNHSKLIFNTAYTIVILWFVYTLGRDTYKFVKINKNNEKEN